MCLVFLVHHCSCNFVFHHELLVASYNNNYSLFGMWLLGSLRTWFSLSVSVHLLCIALISVFELCYSLS